MSTSHEPSTSSNVIDVTEASFQTEVIDRSRRTGVIVDFWASWCAPCLTLGPMLETAVEARNGEVVLAKVDVDANPALARNFRVQGIPHVIGFRGGRVATQFTGVLPAREIERHLDEVTPSEADRAVARAGELHGDDAIAELRRARELDDSHRGAAIGLAEALVESDPEEAGRLVTPHRPDPAGEGVMTRIELSRTGGGDIEELRADLAAGDGNGAATHLDLGRALAAGGDYGEAIEHLLEAVELGGDTRESAREQLVALFGVLGDDPLVAAARPRLSRTLF